MVRELGFEMKAQPSNRMKTEEELAKEEQERLRKLEVRGQGTGWPTQLDTREAELAHGGLSAQTVFYKLFCSILEDGLDCAVFKFYVGTDINVFFICKNDHMK